MKTREEAVEDRCPPECTQARCLCRLDGPRELRGGTHMVKRRQPSVPMWPQISEEEGAPPVFLHHVKHMWVRYADGSKGASEEEAETQERQAKVQVLTARKLEPKQAVL